MEQLEWKIKIAALWFFQSVNYTAYMLALYAETGSFSIINANISGMPIVVCYFLFCLVTWLTFILKPSISRWLNIVLGIYVLGIKITGTVMGLLKAIKGELTFGVFINEGWALITAVLIIWYGWKYPKKAKVETT